MTRRKNNIFPTIKNREILEYLSTFSTANSCRMSRFVEKQTTVVENRMKNSLRKPEKVIMSIPRGADPANFDQNGKGLFLMNLPMQKIFH